MMPLPTPVPDENRDEFIDRCMEEADEFEDPAQRRAVCETQWDNSREESQVMKYPDVIKAVYGTPWAIRPEILATICEIVQFRAEGGVLTEEEIQGRIGAAPVRAGAARNGTIAVLPLYGIIAQRMNLMMATSGGTSTELFGKALQQALDDPSISAVVIDIDSPGGSVFGVPELAQTIADARGRKPIVAVANSQAASAAYWIASAVDELVITPSGEVGSIGVLAAHEDLSTMQEKLGVKTTLVSAGKFKSELSPLEPLGAEAREALQARVNDYYEMFVQGVARGRGVSVGAVRGGFGQGRMVAAQQAVQMGMADRVGTLEGTLQRLLGSGGRAGPRAEGAEGIPLGTDLLIVDTLYGSLQEDEVPGDDGQEEIAAADRDWRGRRLRLRG